MKFRKWKLIYKKLLTIFEIREISCIIWEVSKNLNYFCQMEVAFVLSWIPYRSYPSLSLSLSLFFFQKLENVLYVYDPRIYRIL